MTMDSESIRSTTFLSKGGKSLAQRAAESFLRGRRDLSKYRSIIEACPCPAFVDDEKGNCILVNESFIKMLGCNLEFIQGAGWQNMIKDDECDQVIDAWKDFIHGKSDMFDMCYSFLNQSNEAEVKCHVTAVKVSEGAGFVGFVKPEVGPNCRCAMA